MEETNELSKVLHGKYSWYCMFDFQVYEAIASNYFFTESLQPYAEDVRAVEKIFAEKFPSFVLAHICVKTTYTDRSRYPGDILEGGFSTSEHDGIAFTTGWKTKESQDIVYPTKNGKIAWIYVGGYSSNSHGPMIARRHCLQNSLSAIADNPNIRNIWLKQICEASGMEEVPPNLTRIGGLTEQIKSDLIEQGYADLKCMNCLSAKTVLANSNMRAIKCCNVSVSLIKNPCLQVLSSQMNDGLAVKAETAVIFTHPEYKDFDCKYYE